MKLFLFTDSIELTRTISECVFRLNHHHFINVETVRNPDICTLDEKKIGDAFFIIDERYDYDQAYFFKNLKKNTLTFLIGERVTVFRAESGYEELPFEQFLLRLENYIYLETKMAKEA